MTKEKDKREALRKCRVCDVYLEANEGFTCPRCRRGPLCKAHRVPGEKECAGCVLEKRVKEIDQLQRQERGIKGFARFLQFIFLLFSVFFIAQKVGIGEFADLLIINILEEYSLYIGILALLGSLAFYIILRSQRGKIEVLESQIKNMRGRSYIYHR